MSKRRDDLKERLKALKVNEPLKLAGEMKPPAERKEVPLSEVPPVPYSKNKSPQIEVTQSDRDPRLSVRDQAVAKASLEAARKERAKDQETQIEVAQSEQPHLVEPYKDEPRFEASKTEHARNEYPQKAYARKQAPQNEAAVPEAPQIEGPVEELFEPRSNQGFFKLSHGVFSEPLIQQLSGDCFRLFLWLSSRAWRFSKSNGQLRASVRFIEDQTGMSHATVSRALKTLKEKGLIRLVEVDFKRGNIWHISALALGARGPEDTPPSGERPQNEVAQSESATPSKRATSCLKSSTRVPQNERNIRSYNNQKDPKKDPTRVFVSEEKNSDADLQAQENAIDYFETEVSTREQAAVIQRFTEQEFPHGFLPPARVIRKMAAFAWYRQAHSMRAQVAV